MNNPSPESKTKHRLPPVAIVLGALFFIGLMGLLYYGVQQSDRPNRDALPSPLIGKPAPNFDLPLLHALATLPEHPDSLPVNALVPVAGTPLGEKISREGEIDPIEFVRTVAVARLVCPASVVRLSAGREGMTPELQALCFLAGANSIFVGGRLLTTPNPEEDEDAALFRALDLKPMIAPRAEA